MIFSVQEWRKEIRRHNVQQRNHSINWWGTHFPGPLQLQRLTHLYDIIPEVEENLTEPYFFCVAQA